MAEDVRLTFNNEDSLSKDFSNLLNKRVNAYFREKGISKFGNAKMYLKTISMLSMYFGAYFVIVVAEPGIWVALALCATMGIGMAGIGLSIMHDAIHGSYSKIPWVNKLFGYTLNLVGGNAINWRIQHNIKHHTYTNVDDHDEDIAPKAGLRLSPNSEKKSFHKFQHIYAWFIYSLGSLFWVTFKDFVKFSAYMKDGSMKKNSKSVAIEILILVCSKFFYWGYIVVVPALFTAYSGGQIAIGFLVIHLFAGQGLAVIFQPAHLMEEVEYPAPDSQGKMQYSWAVHQLYTTINFGNDNKILEWYAGGLNFQIEHHLFPHICHVHYKGLAPIVKETAREFNLPYYSKSTFFEALTAHTQQLKLLGS